MTKKQLLKALKKIQERQIDSIDYSKCDRDHIEADAFLLEYIDDPAITAVFHDIEKWYA